MAIDCRSYRLSVSRQCLYSVLKLTRKMFQMEEEGKKEEEEEEEEEEEAKKSNKDKRGKSSVFGWLSRRQCGRDSRGSHLAAAWVSHRPDVLALDRCALRYGRRFGSRLC